MRARSNHLFAIAVAIVAVLAALLAGQGTMLPGNADASPAACTIGSTDTSVAGQVTLTIGASSADCTWTVPTGVGVSSVRFAADGAAGASQNAYFLAGNGGSAAGTFDAAGGDLFVVEVGIMGGPPGSPNTSGSCPIPGGPGGHGGFNTGGKGGQGGNGPVTGGCATTDGGGGGGGGTFVWDGSVSDSNLLVVAGGGGGGSGLGGHAGGGTTNLVSSGHAGGTGSLGNSGSCGNFPCIGGGGGGGGYLGGSGGGDNQTGGWGGSSFVATTATNVSESAGVQSASGRLTITYNVNAAPTLPVSDTYYFNVDSPGAAAIQATGSPAPLFSVASGSSLPAWLTLATTCGTKSAAAGLVYLCGTPPAGTAGAEYTFDVTATNTFDGSDHTATEAVTVQVDPGEVTVALTGPDGNDYYDATYSEQVVVTATLTAYSEDSPAPSLSKDEGNVQFWFYDWITGQSTSIDASCDSVTVVNSQAQCIIPAAALSLTGGPNGDGEYEVWAAYSGGADYYDATSNTFYLDDYPAYTTTTATSSENSSTFGQAVTFTATVTADPPATINPTTEGTVEFDNSGTLIPGCGAVALIAGQATCTTGAQYLTGGNHNITATFTSTSDNYYDSDVSATLVQVVNAAATITTVTASPNSPVDVSDGLSHSVTYTATVTAAGSPVTSGSVTFKDVIDTTTVYTCSNVPVASDGTANCLISYSHTGSAVAGVGEHTVTATYSDSAGNYATSSDSYTMDIDQAPAITSADSGKATIGVPFSSLVTATGFPAPTFSLAEGFSLPDGLSFAATCGNATAPAGSVYICGTPALGTVGTHTFTILASNGVGSSAEQDFILQISAAATATTLAASPDGTMSYGQPLTLTATVSPSDKGSTATVSEGTVDFSAGSSPLCTGVAVTNGAAECVLDNSSPAALALLAALHAGTSYTLTAAYTDAAENFLTSSSTPVSEAVTSAATTTTASASDTSPVYGDSITITAHVAANTPSVIDPGDDPSAAGAGTVTFEIDGVTDSGCALLAAKSGDATAQCALPVLPAGDHSIRVLYNAGTDYTSSDTTIPVKIAKADTATTLTSSADPALTGESVILTATVTAQAPASLNPDTVGSVTFTDTTTGSTLCPAIPLNGGQATCTATFSANGPHVVSAAYSGDDNYNASTGSLTETIRSTTATAVSAAYYDTAPGPTFAITATVTAPSGLVVDEGSVSFYAGGTLLCTVAVDNGQALCEAPAGPLGGSSHTITASYLGTDDFLPSSGIAGATSNPAGPIVVTITPTTSGTGWVVQGAGFSGTTSVTVCGLSVPFTLVNDTTILIGVPVVNAPQQCVVTVTATGGTASSNGKITVVAQPQPGAPSVVYPSGPGTGPAPGTCTGTTELTLSGQWTLIAWPGADTPVAPALAGGSDGCGTNVSGQVSVIWGFDAVTQTYQAYFPGEANVPGANDLESLQQGAAYWVSLVDPSSTVSWSVSS